MIRTIEDKKIGIWGFGVTGQSILRYLHQMPCTITIFEQKKLSPDLVAMIHDYRATICPHDNPIEFIESQDIIVPSPGINIEPYRVCHDKFLTEVDLFQKEFTKKMVAITGSVGKTSITHLLGQLLNAAQINVGVGGNIGTGMLDLIDQKNNFLVLELSSFQLEHSTIFAPDIAVITNLYPNHLDRHGTMERYFKAKYKIIAHQKKGQIALMPFELIDQCNQMAEAKSDRYFFSWSLDGIEYQNQLGQNDGLFFVENSIIVLLKNGLRTELVSIDAIPTISLQENWLILYSILYLMKIPLTLVNDCRHNLLLPEDRLEKIETINDIVFYNDSKSTTNQSTIAAVNALHGRPIHLFLGGLSKGVDRTPLIEYLKNRVVHIYCFGKEADDLRMLCQTHSIPCFARNTLEEAFTICVDNIQPHDQILFSPGGASYDLFKDYKERGLAFKKIVQQYKIAQTVDSSS